MKFEKWFRKDAQIYYCKGCGVQYHWSDVGSYNDEDRFILDEDTDTILCDECAEKATRSQL